MNYYHLRSIIASNKKPIALSQSSDSFLLAQEDRPYIEPPFKKEIFDVEQPAVMLISAVGATGKSILSRKLSQNVGIPLLDLAKHKPVGDNSLTGLLTQSFPTAEISAVFEGLSTGAFGVIIDGVDEGRSKTTGEAFYAFLDDIAARSGGASRTSVVMLGRTQVLEDCWEYLSERGVNVALVTISAFALDSARTYIDTFTDGLQSPHADQYVKLRDYILDRLSAAFSHDDEASEFLSFIGYPPVLDAIVTLINQEQNYHKLLERIVEQSAENVEIELVESIVRYILIREREEKILPNIIEPLISDAPEPVQKASTAQRIQGGRAGGAPYRLLSRGASFIRFAVRREAERKV